VGQFRIAQLKVDADEVDSQNWEAPELMESNGGASGRRTGQKRRG
jgi:hypothetical protein